MARLARVVAVGVPHHVTQRGNARQFILACDADRKVYLGLLRQSISLHGVDLIGYCLMSNHVHLIAVPQKGEVLGLALKNAHGRYCGVLERKSSFDRPCLAGEILFLSSGRAAFMGSVAVHGAESGACRDGGYGCGVGMVQCYWPMQRVLGG
jgi:REP element-mobilizing transposase RayT